MPYPSVFFIHNCTITQRRADGQDTSGGIIYTETVLPARPCRMSSNGEVKGVNGIIYSAKCSLAATTDIEEDDILESEDIGFKRRYWVNSVRQIYEATGGRISHTVLELREMEYAERISS